MFNFIKRERLVSGYLPLVGHMSDGVVLLDDGSVFAMLELAGLPWETCDPRNVSERQIRLNHTYRNIAADSVVVSVYQCRGMASPDVYPSGAFRSAFSEHWTPAIGRTCSTAHCSTTVCTWGSRDARRATPASSSANRSPGGKEPRRKRQKTAFRRLEDTCAMLACGIVPGTGRAGSGWSNGDVSSSARSLKRWS